MINSKKAAANLMVEFAISIGIFMIIFLIYSFVNQSAFSDFDVNLITVESNSECKINLQGFLEQTYDGTTNAQRVQKISSGSSTTFPEVVSLSKVFSVYVFQINVDNINKYTYESGSEAMHLNAEENCSAYLPIKCDILDYMEFRLENPDIVVVHTETGVLNRYADYLWEIKSSNPDVIYSDKFEWAQAIGCGDCAEPNSDTCVNNCLDELHRDVSGKCIAEVVLYGTF